MERIFAHKKRLPLRPKNRVWDMAEHARVAKREAAALWAITPQSARKAAAARALTKSARKAAAARAAAKKRAQWNSPSHATTSIQVVAIDGGTPLSTQQAPQSKRRRTNPASRAPPAPPPTHAGMREALFAHQQMFQSYQMDGDDQFRSLAISQCAPSRTLAPISSSSPSPSCSSSAAQTCFNQGFLRVITFIVLLMLLVCCSMANLDAQSLEATMMCCSSVVPVVCEWFATCLRS
jgi:hypothetical protein